MCYLDANGRMKTNAWILHNGYWYYVNGSGYRLYGWQQIGGKWYYFKPNGTMVDSCWIYKDANGYTPYSGFSKMTLSKYPHYLIDANGAMATGWRKVDGKWFYFDNSGLMVKEKWAKDSVGWCYLDRYGIMLTNCWKQDSKGWCYIGESGYILTNKWLQKNGCWYYLDNAGYRVSGWKQLGGKWYYFYSDGTMASNTYMDGGWIDGNGVWRAG
jgi:glucan-binding YG repeat protein